MLDDLTILFLTVNKVPESWVEYHKSILLEAVGGTPIITISKNPLDWGLNLIQEEEPSVNNIYRQILRGAKLAPTPYIAIAEDDVLYSKDHFLYRPPLNTFAYNVHRWGLFTWGKPTFYYKHRISNATLIASRELVIESLEERFARYPESNIGEMGKEKGTRLNRHETIMFYSKVPVIYFSHRNSLDPTEQHKSKKMSPVQAYEIPYWGRAEELVKHFI